jgi:hypothetical protein
VEKLTTANDFFSLARVAKRITFGSSEVSLGALCGKNSNCYGHFRKGYYINTVLLNT